MSRDRGATLLRKVNPMTVQQRIVFNVLLLIGLSMTAMFAFWWFNPAHIANNFGSSWHLFDYVLFAAVSYVIWHQIISEAHSWLIARDLRHPKKMYPQKGLKVAFATAFVPGKEPYDILENTLRSMVAARYPHDTWLLDEGNDRIAKQICEKYGVLHFSRKGKTKYNTESGKFKAKTKGGNHNSWHDKHGKEYDIVAQIDVDFVPKKNFLTATLGYFKDPSVAFVGTPQIYGNLKESWIAEGAAQQAYGFYGSTQKGLFGKDMHLFIGANHIVRVKALEDIGGYPGHIVEDHLSGMHLYRRGWKSVYVAEKLAIGEGPATWEAYFSQQMRWAYGLIDILYKHSPKILPRMRLKHAINYFLLQQHYFYGLVQAIGVLLIALFLIFNIQATSMPLQPILLLYVPLLVWQMLMGLWLQRFNVDPKNESGLLIKGRLLTLATWPIYFLAFMSILTGKRLTYAVTPKGDQQMALPSLKLFLPHVILGSITGVSLLFAIEGSKDAPVLIFWAVVNTISMYGFALYIALQRLSLFASAQVFNFVRTARSFLL